MAKQGQHHNDGNDPDVSRGNNNPSKSTRITTGTPKKRETYDEQAYAHENPGKQAQESDKPEWHLHTPKNIAAKDLRGDSSRTGSDSNEKTSTRGH